jgi:hypothetical protein
MKAQRPAWANSSRDPHLQINQSKIHWKCGSSSRMLALQVQRVEFNPRPNKKGKREKKPACISIKTVIFK